VKRDYELGFILNPEVSEEEAKAMLDRIERVVTSNEGQIVKVNQWGRRRLAYPIERHRDGLYTFIDMILTPESVIELERTLKVSEIVLRHMVRRRDAKIVQKEREERVEREEREAKAAALAAANAAAPAPAAEPAPVAVAEPEFDADGPTEEELADVPPAIEEEAVQA
jgi:small subunit ribosomal protein S6